MKSKWHLIFISVIITMEAGCMCTGGRVEHLPGFEGGLPFDLETGYVGVQGDSVHLFYYFIRSESNPEEDPLMLWITGGPGCSSITGLLIEIGPIKFQEDTPLSLPPLVLRPNSWTKMASIIFLDIPVGTGFSYATTESASQSTDLQLCDQAYEFIRKWLYDHPDFNSNPFYVGGDSYSGNPVPIITQLISNGNEASIEPYINLKGYVLGNPLTFGAEENYQILFAHSMGFVTNDLYKSLLLSCHGEYREEYINPNNNGCLQSLEYYNECIDGIEKSQVLEPHCDYFYSPTPTPIKLPSQRQQHSAYYRCRVNGYKPVYRWANDPAVREALHIQKGSIGDWVRCNNSLPFTRTLDDVRPYHQNLSNKGYRSLIYSGDHDMVIPHQSTQAWVKDLNYSIIDPWRSWKVHGQVAGYTETYSNKMTFISIKGGGHTTPEYKPEECFFMFKRWISHQQL